MQWVDPADVSRWHVARVAQRGIDGFTTYIGFLPERDIGLVVLNNMNPASLGNLFYLAVLNHLLSQRFGLNQGVNERIDTAYDQAIAKLSETSKQAVPVNRATVAPFLGSTKADTGCSSTVARCKSALARASFRCGRFETVPT
jgi:hypothetical protein